MRFASAFLTLLFFIILLENSLAAKVNQNGDFQLWNYWSLDKKFKNKWGSRYIGEIRWGDNVSRLYCAYGQAQIVYAEKWLEVATGYRQEYNNTDKQWVTLYTPMSDITFFLSNKWELDNRSRILYYIPAHAFSYLVYRNRLRLTSPQISYFFNIKAFVDDEVFFQNKLGFCQNRLSIGFFGAPKSFLKGRIFYMCRSLKQNDVWMFQNVLSTQIYFYF